MFLPSKLLGVTWHRQFSSNTICLKTEVKVRNFCYKNLIYIDKLVL